MKKITVLLVLLIALLQYKLWFGDGNVLEFQRLNDRIAELRQEGAKRRERNAALEAEVMDLKQGLDAVEERARHELGMIKEGEDFVQVIENPPEPETIPAPSDAKPVNPNPEPVAGKKSTANKPKKQKYKEADKPPPTESKPSSKPKPATASSGNKPKNQGTVKKKPKPPAPPSPREEQPLLDDGPTPQEPNDGDDH